MRDKPPGDTNELLVRLYALSHQQPMAQFQDAALAMLKPALPFDAAIWGAATTGAQAIDIHTFHLHNKTPDMVAEYEEVKHLDTASRRMFDKPEATMAFHTSSFFSAPEQRPIRDFMLRHEQPNFLITTEVKPIANSSASLLHWVTLYRAQEDARFSQADVSQLQVFAPHLKQALALNRTLQLGRAAGGWGVSATAIVDSKGFIHGHDDQLVALVSEASGEDFTNSTRLPPGLRAQLALNKKVFIWQKLVARCHTEHGLIFLKLRAQALADTLTEREKEIALLVAKGYTYKQVAVQLGNAPATVRNQIQTIYSKLQVNNVAALVGALSALM